MEFIFNGHSKESGIYKITNKVNGNVYIGSAKEFKERVRNHLNSLKKNKHHNKHLQASWNKHGPDAFMFEVVEVTVGTMRQRRLLEERYIKKQMKLGNCFNTKVKTIKRQGPWSSTPEESKRKLSESLKMSWTEERKREYSEFRWPEEERNKQSLRSKELWQDPEYQEHMREIRTGQTRSDETKQKLRDQKLGELNPMFGKDFSAEHRENMGLSRRGKKLGPTSDETKKRISDSRKGKGCIPCSEEKRLKLSLANKGKKPSQLAIQRTIETKTKEYDVWLLSPEGNEIFLNKITKDFLTTYGLSNVGLNKLLNKRIKNHRGWVILKKDTKK